MSLWLKLRARCDTAPLLETSQEKWPTGVLDPENNLVTIKKEIILIPLKEIIRQLRILNAVWELWPWMSPCLSFPALKRWNFLSLLLNFFIFSAFNPGKGSFGCLNIQCFAQETPSLAKHLKLLLLTQIPREEVWAEICSRGKNKLKQETNFQEGICQMSAVNLIRKSTLWRIALNCLGGEVIVQRILNGTPWVFRLLVDYRNWWDDLSSKKPPRK